MSRHRRRALDVLAGTVATAVVALFVQTMSVERILPAIGAPPAPTARALAAGCDRGAVALTFEGGPDPRVTGPLIALLRREHVAAAFFLDPDRAEAAPALARELAANGHLVAVSLPGPASGPRPALPAGERLARARRLFARAGLGELRRARPAAAPDGELRRAAATAAVELVGWTRALDGRDTDLVAPATIRAHIVDHLRPGGVIRLHDTGLAGENSLAALAWAIDGVRRRGYCLDRLDEHGVGWAVLDAGATGESP